MSDDDADRAGFRVEGRVQGVGFRWWTRRTATDLGLRGTVRNCADGSVEVHAAGAAHALDRLRTKLERGPTSARVRSVEPIPTREGLPDDFQIVR